MDKLALALKKFLQPGKYILAFSGGADSVALVLAALELMKQSTDYSFVAVHVEHGIRGEEALRDMAFAADFCRQQGIVCLVRHVDVPDRMSKTGESMEQAARILRYTALSAVQKEYGALRILTAHHANDQAETMLLHLVRGSALRGLAGMNPDNGLVVRPFLDFTKRELMDYCRQRKAGWVEDSSNVDLDHSRNYLRHEVLPLLEKLNSSLVRSLGHTVKSLQEDEAALEFEGSKFFSNRAKGKMLLAEHWSAVPAAVRKRSLRTWLEGYGVGVTWTHIENMDQLIIKNVSNKELALPGATVTYAYHKLYLDLDAKHIRH